MNFSEQPASKQWAPLIYKEETIAEVWFKPEGEPFVLAFRIPQKSFQIPGMGRNFTIENLLKTVGIASEEVESWRLGDAAHSGMNGTNPELKITVPPPPQHIPHVEFRIRLKAPPAAIAPHESSALDIPSATWQDLESRWKFIVGLEASIDGQRMSMGTLLAELEASLSKNLTVEEKLHAARADVDQWTKAKHRVHQAIPKMKDVIHRCVWAVGSPERKRLEALYKDHIQPRVPFPQMAAVLEELEALQKDRQILSSLGKTVFQEARTISTNVKTTLMTLQSNAAANAQKKKAGSGGGRFFKSVRRATGA